jgi:hypothetical protein
MAESIEDTKLRLEAFISENYPNIDTAPGSVFSELVIKMAAYLQNPIFNELQTLNQAKAISEVIGSATDTYSAVIDAVASNYNTSRFAGKKSQGKLKVYMIRNTNAYINAGFTFYQPVVKLNYKTTTNYVVTTNPTELNHLRLIQQGELYYFIIPIEAENVGAEYQLSDKTKLSLGSNVTLTNFTDAEVYGNFTSGLPVDTDKILISKFQQSLANKTLLSKYSILSKLKEIYPIQALSIVGANDAEMTRSKHNIFGLSTSGKVDAYVRSSLGMETTQFTKTGTYIGNNNWTFSIDSVDAPGFYRIISILPTPTTISAEDRSGTLLHTASFEFDSEKSTQVNDIYTNAEGRFSAYQTCDVIVEFPAIDAIKDETKRDFNLLVSNQPYISEIQNVFLEPDYRVACADYLIKAAIPCFVSVALTVYRRNTTVELPIELIKQDIFKYINSLDFGQTLIASKLIDICHNYDITHVELPIKMTGSILGLDNSVIEIQSNNELIIPVNYTAGVTPNTTLFFADYFNTSNVENMAESIDIKAI